jgi:hypothetical protein
VEMGNERERALGVGVKLLISRVKDSCMDYE